MREPDFENGFRNGLFTCLAKFKLKKYTLSTGFYAYFIEAWLDKFPFENHLFLDYETFRSQPVVTLHKISQFLGISPFLNATPRWKYNKANTRDGAAHLARIESENIPSTLRSDLVNILRTQVQKVYDIIGENLKWKLDSLS